MGGEKMRQSRGAEGAPALAQGVAPQDRGHRVRQERRGLLRRQRAQRRHVLWDGRNPGSHPKAPSHFLLLPVYHAVARTSVSACRHSTVPVSSLFHDGVVCGPPRLPGNNGAVQQPVVDRLFTGTHVNHQELASFK
eukprot:3941019-Rhodomonas_salina.3